MEEKLISFETAKVAKVKGFKRIMGDLDFHIPFYEKGGVLKYRTRGLNNPNIVFAPTQSLLQKWLRENHSINIVVDSTMDIAGNHNGYFVWIKSEQTNKEIETETSKTYEEALEAGLLEALKLI